VTCLSDARHTDVIVFLRLDLSQRSSTQEKRALANGGHMKTCKKEEVVSLIVSVIIGIKK
jgi:hypothetical protein